VQALLDFQTASGRFGRCHSTGPLRGRSPTPPSHVPSDRPFAPSRAGQLANGDQTPCRFTLRSQLERPGRSKNLLQQPLLEVLWQGTQACTGPPSWLSGPAGFLLSGQDGGCEEMRLLPQFVHHRRRMSAVAGAGGGAGCWERPRWPRPQAPIAFALGCLARHFAIGAPFGTPIARPWVAGVRAPGPGGLRHRRTCSPPAGRTAGCAWPNPP